MDSTALHTTVNRISDRTFAWMLAGMSMLWNLAVGAQGFDMLDEGWSLTAYQQVFSDPESVSYQFLYYLTDIIGGAWELAFGCGGIYAYRVLTAILLTINALLAFHLMRPYMPRSALLLGILASYACSDYGIMVFYHNYLTALLATVAVCLMVRALTTHSLPCMTAAAAVIAINIFSRLPNVSFLALLLVLIPYYIYNGAPKTLRMAAAAALGLPLGVALVVAVMLLIGHNHLPIFLQAIADGNSAASDPGSSHNLAAMAATYLRIYCHVFTHGIFSNTYTVYQLGTPLFLAVILCRRYPPALVYMATLILLAMHLQPLGSDFGIQNMGENSIYLATPFAFGIVARWLKANHCQPDSHSSQRSQCLTDTPVSHSSQRSQCLTDSPVSHSGQRSQCLTDTQSPKHFTAFTHNLPSSLYPTLSHLAILFALLFILRGIKHISHQCYFDEGPRTQKRFLPDNPLATTFTTAENCRQLNDILHHIQPYVKPGDTILCFQNMPALHYLTRTRPYLRNAWPWSYDPGNMDRKFRDAQQRHTKLPVVIREKTMVPRWTVPYPAWDDTHSTDNYFHKNHKVQLIQQFLATHHYTVVWQNDVCQLLIP